MNPVQRSAPKAPSTKPAKVKLNREARAFYRRLDALWKQAVQENVDLDERQLLSPGLYFDIPFEVYQRIDAINNSSLNRLMHSPAAYHNPPPAKESEAFRFGSLVHTAVLEPEALLDRYLIIPDFTKQIGPNPKTGQPYDAPKMTNAYKALVNQFRADHPDRLLVEAAEFNQMVALNKAVWSNPQARELLSVAVAKEVTLVWQEPKTQLLCKGRIDVLGNGFILDLKTTSDLTTFHFSIGDYGYHRQLAFYLAGAQTLQATPQISANYNLPDVAYICAIESKPPHCCHCAPLQPKALRNGWSEIESMLETLRLCQQRGEWPGPDMPTQWSLDNADLFVMPDSVRRLRSHAAASATNKSGS